MIGRLCSFRANNISILIPSLEIQESQHSNWFGQISSQPWEILKASESIRKLVPFEKHAPFFNDPTHPPFKNILMFRQDSICYSAQRNLTCIDHAHLIYLVLVLEMKAFCSAVGSILLSCYPDVAFGPRTLVISQEGNVGGKGKPLLGQHIQPTAMRTKTCPCQNSGLLDSLCSMPPPPLLLTDDTLEYVIFNSYLYSLPTNTGVNLGSTT